MISPFILFASIFIFLAEKTSKFLLFIEVATFYDTFLEQFIGATLIEISFIEPYVLLGPWYVCD